MRDNDYQCFVVGLKDSERGATGKFKTNTSMIQNVTLIALITSRKCPLWLKMSHKVTRTQTYFTVMQAASWNISLLPFAQLGKTRLSHTILFYLTHSTLGQCKRT